MISELYKKIKAGENVRHNLSELRKELKENSQYAFLYHYGAECGEVFKGLLENEDAKTRKNTALLMGELGKEEFLECLINAYWKEKKLFIRSSYLKAIKQFDYRKYLPELKQRLEELVDTEVSIENQKHIQEEKKVLTELVIMMEGTKIHKFKGFYETTDIILLTNRDHINVTLDQVDFTQAKEFNAGVMVRTNNIKKIIQIRTYEELLFIVPGVKTCTMNTDKLAEILGSKQMFEFIRKRHDGDFPYYFRVELKSKMPLDKKSSFTKKLAMKIEKVTKRKFINSVSDYELEFRLIENKEGNFNILLKLYTLKDERFTYRKETVASSIKPVNAALTMKLVQKYLKEDGSVLDPFCGSGTMLIERHKAVRANTMYGIDIFGEAIKKARINTEQVHQIIHYINRDFFDFKHEYVFDEIITDMPFSSGKKSPEAILLLYKDFFRKSREHLKQGGIMILYSHDKGYIKKFALQNNFHLEKMIDINKRKKVCVCILRKN